MTEDNYVWYVQTKNGHKNYRDSKESAEFMVDLLSNGTDDGATMGKVHRDYYENEVAPEWRDN